MIRISSLVFLMCLLVSANAIPVGKPYIQLAKLSVLTGIVCDTGKSVMPVERAGSVAGAAVGAVVRTAKVPRASGFAMAGSEPGTRALEESSSDDLMGKRDSAKFAGFTKEPGFPGTRRQA
ncbi:hypothetical protein FB451DRAFT_1174509 [Mycena latifolia]|nr:hypothetical protein FB451DRAFT_1174509 [Mycena latifolia]